jgi:hypothetical protein
LSARSSSSAKRRSCGWLSSTATARWRAIDTTDEHPFHLVDTGNWTRADLLQVGDRLSAIGGEVQVLAVSFGDPAGAGL